MNERLLRILLIEEVLADAEIYFEAFQKVDVPVLIDVCRRREELEELLGTVDFDVILTAYHLTNWNGLEVIDIVRSLGKNIPTLIVTRPLGDEIAVECLLRGAAGYALKDQMSLLPFVVRRALDQDASRGKQTAEELARRNEELVRYAKELKDAACRAEAESRAKTDFLVSMSHEIRTPMNVIIGIADLLADSQLTESQAKHVDVFRHAGENLLILVNRLLDISRIESGKLELERVAFDLNSILASTTEFLDIPARAKGLSLSFHIAPGVPTRLIGDPFRLRQVLTNLIGNAIKFTEKGSITVEAGLGQVFSSQSSSIQFKVSDTGVGIADDKKTLIFESFTQAETSFSRLYGGSGLGLGICRALIDKMKGKITVESAPGLGSTFRFTAQFDLQPDGSRDESKSGPWKVLLCEDSPDNAYLVKAYLEGTPYQIEHVPNGAAGVDKFKSGIFDLVLMDMQMPVLDGYAATRQIRRWEIDEGRRPTPILALSANAQKEHSERCAASGCTEFLSKPIRKAGLLAALAKQTASRGSEDCDLLPAVQELIPAYLEQKRLDLDRLFTAIQSADYATISTVGHQLKGSGPSYGFEEFSKIGIALERAGESRNLEETRSQAALLAAFVSSGPVADSNIS